MKKKRSRKYSTTSRHFGCSSSPVHLKMVDLQGPAVTQSCQPEATAVQVTYRTQAGCGGMSKPWYFRGHNEFRNTRITRYTQPHFEKGMVSPDMLGEGSRHCGGWATHQRGSVRPVTHPSTTSMHGVQRPPQPTMGLAIFQTHGNWQV